MSVDELLEEVDVLVHESAANPDIEVARRLLRLRHAAGIQMIESQDPDAELVGPDFDAVPGAADLIEIGRDDLRPGRLRAAILSRGCLLVRGLAKPDEADQLLRGIRQAFDARSRRDGAAADGYYEEFIPAPSYASTLAQRAWIEEGGALLAVDSPRLSLQLRSILQGMGFLELVRDYLGGRAVVSAQKTTFRKAASGVKGAWHQDGKFLGSVRVLNLWLSLTHCGDEAPGLDIVPRRLDSLVEAGGEGAFLEQQVPDVVARKAAGKAGVLRPIFEPGDALLFDDLFLHQTGSDPGMTETRFALESWFFAPSTFPTGYAPLAA